MDTVEALLEQLAAESDPRGKWLLLEQAGSGLAADPAIEAERLWWQARYLFMDKKKTLVRDRFVWLLIVCKGASRSRPKKNDPLAGEYRDTLCCPQIKAAIEADDRLWPQLLDACRLYAHTLRQPPSFFGLTLSTRQPSQQETNRRVGEELVQTLMEPLVQRCFDQPHLDLVLRALFEGAKEAYPGIQPDLLANIELVPVEEIRQRITAAVRDTSFGGY